jgi:hypothetical protein
LVDGTGVPLASVVTGANRHDASQLENLLDSLIIERPDIGERPQHLCLDAGCSGEPAKVKARKGKRRRTPNFQEKMVKTAQILGNLNENFFDFFDLAVKKILLLAEVPRFLQ